MINYLEDKQNDLVKFFGKYQTKHWHYALKKCFAHFFFLMLRIVLHFNSVHRSSV